MNILASSRELNSKELYFTTKAPDIRKMSDAAGSVLDIDYWVEYQDTNKDGETQTIISIATPDGVYASNSASFIRAFSDIMECFTVDEIKRIKVDSGKSNAGRTFLTCVYSD